MRQPNEFELKCREAIAEADNLIASLKASLAFFERDVAAIETLSPELRDDVRAAFLALPSLHAEYLCMAKRWCKHVARFTAEVRHRRAKLFLGLLHSVNTITSAEGLRQIAVIWPDQAEEGA